jgi:hypothetical protein
MASFRLRLWATGLLGLGAGWGSFAGSPPVVLEVAGSGGLPMSVTQATPLDSLTIAMPPSGSVEVRDGKGRTYFSSTGGARATFLVGGALGRQSVTVRDASGQVTGEAAFTVDAETSIDDGGKYRDMFHLFHRGMSADYAGGVESVEWQGRTYHMFVNWVLDNYQTAKGLRYFNPQGTDFVDMMRAAQREDGMIWSNINLNEAAAYYQTAYGPFGYVRKIGNRYFVRQPAENHPEYLYVSTIYQTWKESGKDAWMRECLASAMRAMDYCVSDPARWSERFRLLKRVYTIDSWDFQVDDAYTPDIGLTNTMLIDPKKSKFGIFFGDNVYYAASCDELAEMLDRAGDSTLAAKYRTRGSEIRGRLNALSWNGKFFTHFVDDDPSVTRDLGVDERSQIAQGNAYALNRGIDGRQAAAIIRTYEALKAHLPPGSPGEWYAIYPPFEKGFGRHDAKWQYMNGGVGGHVAGELARGALEWGFEDYGRDILDRLTSLGHRYGEKISFAYTGSIPPAPPPPHYTPLDLSALANMDIEDRGGPGSIPWMEMGKPGDDIRGLPTGDQEFAGIAFRVAVPDKNQRRSAIAVSHRAGMPAEVSIPIHSEASSVYLLHTATKPTSEKVCGSMAFEYADGTRQVQYLMMGKQLTYWWFPELSTPSSGVAWHGPSPVSADVGLSWCAVDNPHPEKRISALRFRAPDDDGIYVLVGATLADRPHYVAPDPVSFGGPDNWAAATAMAAMLEGLAGVTDSASSETFSHPTVAPRWDISVNRSIRATVRYAASSGYVAYIFSCNPDEKEISLELTGSGGDNECQLLLPETWTGRASVTVDGLPVPFTQRVIEHANYAVFRVVARGTSRIRLAFK